MGKQANSPDGEWGTCIRRQLHFRSQIKVRFKKLSPASKAEGRAIGVDVSWPRMWGTLTPSPPFFQGLELGGSRLESRHCL